MLINFLSVPATANVKAQYTAPADSKQIDDSTAIASKMIQSIQAALNTPTMEKIVVQVGLKMVQPSVIVNSLGELTPPSKGSIFFNQVLRLFLLDICRSH